MQTAQQLLHNLETNWSNLPLSSREMLTPAQLRAARQIIHSLEANLFEMPGNQATAEDSRAGR